MILIRILSVFYNDSALSIILGYKSAYQNEKNIQRIHVLKRAVLTQAAVCSFHSTRKVGPKILGFFIILHIITNYQFQITYTKSFPA